MRLIFIRHGEPDYEHDSLTEKGWREAKLLAARTKDWHVDDFYVSPLGRARDTASFTLKAHGKTAEIMDWLHEFLGKVPDGAGGTRLCWDLMPADWTAQPELLQPTGWEAAPLLQGTNVKAEYDRVTAGLDALLASYGYTRHGGYYTCRETCEKTIVCFCHFGITAVLLSHLWNVSPFAVLHGAFLAPTSTAVDRRMADRMARIANISLDELGKTIFSASISDDKPADALLFTDFKDFHIADHDFGVSQITCVDSERMMQRKDEFLAVMQKTMAERGYTLMILMLTDVLLEGTHLLYLGDEDIITQAFGVQLKDHTCFLPGVVSRKKQVIPMLTALWG